MLSSLLHSFLGNYDTEDSYVIHFAYFCVEIYSVFLVILHGFMLAYEKVCGMVFFSQNTSSRKWKFDLLNSEIRDHFAVYFIIISAWEMFEVWIYTLDQISS